jgi:DNA end-binding protein Ku
MAPRANWKGFLRLSLVTCPIALFPATSESEKISFNQINKKTGHRIRYLKVDADTGEEVSNEDIIKGYQVDKDRYLEVTKEEIETSRSNRRTIKIDEFVPRGRSTISIWCARATSSRRQGRLMLCGDPRDQ